MEKGKFVPRSLGLRRLKLWSERGPQLAATYVLVTVAMRKLDEKVRTPTLGA